MVPAAVGVRGSPGARVEDCRSGGDGDSSSLAPLGMAGEAVSSVPNGARSVGNSGVFAMLIAGKALRLTIASEVVSCYTRQAARGIPGIRVRPLTGAAARWVGAFDPARANMTMSKWAASRRGRG